MSMRKVSIIIPAYNVSAYIEFCVMSLLRQSYTNIEILLVDDGSKDTTPEICDKMATMDARILVFHKQNGGVSSARNHGIRHATGDYIMFIDGDDWLEETCIEDMLRRVDETHSDACFCNRYYKDDNTLQVATTLTSEGAISTLNVLKIHLHYGFIASPCLSLLRRDCVQQVFFNERIHTLEDWEYNFRCLASMDTISILDKAYYHYRTVDSSASLSPLNAKKLTCFMIARCVNEHIQKNNLPLREEARFVPVFLVYHMLVCYSGHGSVDDCERLVRNFARKTLLSVSCCRSIGIKYKSYLLLASIHPILFKRLYCIKNKNKRKL